MNLVLHDYQKRAISFAVRVQKSYQMVDLGLGKTAIALAVGKKLKRYNIPMFVFAPLRVCYTVWPDERNIWTSHMSYTILHGINKHRRIKLDRDIYLLNYEGLKWFYTMCTRRQFKLRKFFIVWDESSMVKSPSTKRFDMFKNLRRMYSNFRMNLSASPAPNGLHDLWAQYYLLDEGQRLFGTYSRFRNKYFIYEHTSRKTFIKNGCKPLIYNKVKNITFRLDAKDYKMMPPTQYNAITIKFPTRLREQYDKLERDFFIDFVEGSINVDSAVGMAMKLRQFLQGGMYLDADRKEYKWIHQLKLEALKELVESNRGHPMLCAIQFRLELDMINKYLNYKVPVIAGGVSSTKSIKLIRQWNEGRIPLLLCHPRSIGHGVNLQKGGYNILWYSQTWSLEEYTQLIGRLARQGQKRSVMVNHLVVKDTLDMVILQVLSAKDRTQSDLMSTLRDYSKLHV